MTEQQTEQKPDDGTASNSTPLLYAERDAMQLDKFGGYYCKHVMAMTTEQLHAKSAIAAELGFRDWIIEEAMDLLDSQCRQYLLGKISEFEKRTEEGI